VAKRSNDNNRQQATSWFKTMKSREGGYLFHSHKYFSFLALIVSTLTEKIWLVSHGHIEESKTLLAMSLLVLIEVKVLTWSPKKSALSLPTVSVNYFDP
jgi:predicted nucleic acid binding AN1-type Zn finger protein